MLNKIENKMKSHGLLDIKSVLVGLSGGADSAALTHVLYKLSKKYGFRVYAAHVNHGLRAKAAERDAEFSKEFAEKLGIEFFLLEADVKRIAREKKISEELAGRLVRYDFFEQLQKKYNIDKIATAHHKNDNAETILMNFMRGSGISGLCGIPYERGNIIRPFLDVKREEIETYCENNGLSYVTDETNTEAVYTRNKIRNILIPKIEKLFNPSFVDTITKNAAVMNADDEFINSEVDKVYNDTVYKNTADVIKLQTIHRAILLRVIRKMVDEACTKQDIPFAVINDIAELVKKNRTGSSVDIARGIYARIEYNKLIFEKHKEEIPEFEYTLKIGESVYIPELGYTVVAERADMYEKNEYEYFGCDDNSSVKIRNRRSGDKFIPLGMNGSKKLKDFMIDEKIPKQDRSGVGIITINNDIAWVVGYRRDKRYKFDKKGIKIKIMY